jgi:hypothetical protein
LLSRAQAADPVAPIAPLSVTPPSTNAEADTGARASTMPQQAASATHWVFGSFSRGYGVATGPLAGRFGSHLGLTVGARGFAFMVGGLPGNRVASLGLEAPRFEGRLLFERGGELSLLWPSLEAHVITDFGDNLFFNVGTTLCGLNYRRPFGRARYSFFLQARAPLVALWIPAEVNGLGMGKTEDRNSDSIARTQRAAPFLSLGAGLEAGIIL